MEQKSEIVRLSTWWIPGRIDAISPDESLITVWVYKQDESDEIGDKGGKFSILLVEFPTGKFRAEIPNDGFTKFNADGSLLVIGNFEAPNRSVHLVETATGKIRAEIPGSGEPSFSPDENSIIIFDNYEDVTRLVRVHTGKTYAEIPSGNCSGNYMPYVSPDHTLLVVQTEKTQTTKLVEITTGAIRAEVSGIHRFAFSPDGKLFTVNDSESRVARIVNVETGEVLPDIEAFGFSFPHEQRLHPKLATLSEKIKSEEKVHKKLFQEIAEINPLVAKAESYRSITPDGEIFLVEDEVGNKLHLVNLTTGEWFAEFDLLNPRWYTLSDRFLIIERHRKSFYQLINARTGRTLAMYHSLAGGSFEKLENGLFLLENGFSIDIYCTSEQKIEGMPPPRSKDGFATPKQGEVAIYESPITLVKTWYSAYRDSILNVLGRYGNEWVYIAIFGSDSPTRFGWIQTELLKVIESWDESPELDPNDPMGSLKKASIKEHKLA